MDNRPERISARLRVQKLTRSSDPRPIFEPLDLGCTIPGEHRMGAPAISQAIAVRWLRELGELEVVQVVSFLTARVLDLDH